MLAVPIQAAFGSTGNLVVSPSVQGCEQAGGTVSCLIDVAFTTVPDASHYTATVTGPDGSVQDFGHVDPGAATLSVTYTGDGTYTVRIDAWGDLGARQAEGAATAN